MAGEGLATTGLQLAATEGTDDQSTLPPSETAMQAGDRGERMAGGGDCVKSVTGDIVTSSGSEMSEGFRETVQKNSEVHQDSSLTISPRAVGEGVVVEGEEGGGEGRGGEGGGSEGRDRGVEGGRTGVRKRKTILALHTDIIGDAFWEAHPHLLGGRDC